MEEIWADINGFEGFYQVSTHGRVRSVIHKDKYGRTFGGNILKQTLTDAGYYRVHLSRFELRSMQFVHRLVAETFIPNPSGLPEVNHKDEKPKNNNVDNLEWCDHKYNINYGNRNRLSGIKHRGEKCYFSKMKESDVREIRKMTNGHITKSLSMELSRHYNVSMGAINNIARKYTWKWIDEEESNNDT